MRFSDLRGRKTVSTATADTVGKVHGFLFDPAARTIVGLELKKTQSGRYLPWHSLTAVGTDAVTVPDASVIVDDDETVTPLTGKSHSVLKKRALATSGDELGKVKDVEFDPETGALQAVIVDDQVIPATRLRGVGSYAVVIDASD